MSKYNLACIKKQSKHSKDLTHLACLLTNRSPSQYEHPASPSFPKSKRPLLLHHWMRRGPLYINIHINIHSKKLNMHIQFGPTLTVVSSSTVLTQTRPERDKPITSPFPQTTCQTSRKWGVFWHIFVEYACQNLITTFSASPQNRSTFRLHRSPQSCLGV